MSEKQKEYIKSLIIDRFIDGSIDEQTKLIMLANVDSITFDNASLVISFLRASPCDIRYALKGEGISRYIKVAQILLGKT